MSLTRVTNNLINKIADQTILGNTSGASASPQSLTPQQVRNITYSPVTVTRILDNTLGAYSNGYSFALSATTTAQAGDIYSNNGHQYTFLNVNNALGLIATSGNGVPTSSGNLTRVNGSGDTTIPFVVVSNLFIPKTTTKRFRVRMVGGGGGGTNGGGLSGGGVGGTTSFGDSGGVPTLAANGGGSPTGGSPTAIAPATTIVALSGGYGGGQDYGATNTIGAMGASGPWGGAGGGGSTNADGYSAANNSGAGGGGGGGGSTIGAGNGGGAGAYIEADFYSINAYYPYFIGTGGGGGSPSPKGGNGGTGLIIIEEYAI